MYFYFLQVLLIKNISPPLSHENMNINGFDYNVIYYYLETGILEIGWCLDGAAAYD